MTEQAEQDWRTAAERESDLAQARALREKARKGGLRFEAYLPSSLAEWVLDLVERGVFTDPGEAVFVILGEHKDLEPLCGERCKPRWMILARGLWSTR